MHSSGVTTSVLINHAKNSISNAFIVSWYPANAMKVMYPHVSEVNRRDQLLWGQIDQQLPEWLVLISRPQVPERIDDGCNSKVNHALLRTNLKPNRKCWTLHCNCLVLKTVANYPTNLRLASQFTPESAKVLPNVLTIFPLDVRGQGLHSLHNCKSEN